MKICLKLLIACLFVFNLPACAGNNSQSADGAIIYLNPKYKKMIQELKESMISYMQEAEPMHTIKDIEECEIILLAYVAAIEQAASKEAGMQAVKDAVIKLNKLNERCEHGLIETDEREQIAEIIISASADKGYNAPHEDVTEQWREW